MLAYVLLALVTGAVIAAIYSAPHKAAAPDFLSPASVQGFLPTPARSTGPQEIELITSLPVRSSSLDALAQPNLRSPRNDSLFYFGNVADEPVDSVFNQTISSAFGYHLKTDKSCLARAPYMSTKGIQEVFQILNELTTIERIPYFLLFGSILGYLRDKRQIPWDQDIDIGMPTWAYDRLMKYETLRPFQFTSGTAVLVLNPQFRLFPPTRQQRIMCNGIAVPAYSDRCSFSANMGRLIYNNIQIDIFAVDDISDVVFITKSFFYVFDDPSLFFPLRRCTLAGAQVFCPNQPYQLMRELYGSNLHPSHACHRNKWVPKSRLKSFGIHLEADQPFDDEVIDVTKRKMGPQEFCAFMVPPLKLKDFGQCNFEIARRKG